jgi:hypothetical protein
MKLSLFLLSLFVPSVVFAQPVTIYDLEGAESGLVSVGDSHKLTAIFRAYSTAAAQALNDVYGENAKIHLRNGFSRIGNDIFGYGLGTTLSGADLDPQSFQTGKQLLNYLPDGDVASCVLLSDLPAGVSPADLAAHFEQHLADNTKSAIAKGYFSADDLKSVKSR